MKTGFWRAGGVAAAALLLASQAQAQSEAPATARAGSGPMPDLILPRPDAPPIWSNVGVAYQAGVYVDDTGYAQALSTAPSVISGRPQTWTGRELSIQADQDDLGGLVVKGPQSHFSLHDSRIRLSGNGSNDFAGLASGVLVDQGALTLDKVDIQTRGLISSAATATNHARLYVADSSLESGGAPLPAGYRPMLGPGMMSPPPGLGITGTARTVVLLDNSDSYFRRSRIVGHGWGALSTDGANGYLYVQVDDSDIEMTNDGYGAYFDYGARAVFNRTKMASRGIGAFIAGAANLTLNDATVSAQRDAFIVHSVMVKENDVGIIDAAGGRIEAGGAVVRVRSANAELSFDAVALESRSGDLVVVEANPDFFATKVTRRPPGVRVTLKDLQTRGAVRNEDPERSVQLTLTRARLEGALQRVELDLDEDSRWTAADTSDITLIDPTDVERIDAKPGVVIRATGAGLTDRALPSGGRLEVQPAQ